MLVPGPLTTETRGFPAKAGVRSALTQTTAVRPWRAPDQRSPRLPLGEAEQASGVRADEPGDSSGSTVKDRSSMALLGVAVRQVLRFDHGRDARDGQAGAS